MVLDVISRQGVLFETLRWREEWALRRGGTVPWTQSTCLTSLVRVPPDIAAALGGTLHPLPAGEHYRYPLSSLHVTVLNLDRLAAAGMSPARILAEAQRAVDSCPPLQLTMGGLSLSRWTVYARVYSPTLPQLRRRLRVALGLPAARLRDELAFCNLLRFEGPVHGRVGELVREHRRSRFGTWVVPTVEIVRTDKVFSQEATQTLGTVGFAPSSSALPGSAGAAAS